MGNIAYGSRLAQDGVHLEDDPAEQAVLGEIRQLRQNGRTLRGIAAALNHRALRTRPGLGLAAGARGENHEAGRSGTLS